MNQKLFITTARGFLGLAGSDLADNATDPQAFLMSSASAAINYGDKVTLWVEGLSPVSSLRVEVEPTGKHKAIAKRVPPGTPLLPPLVPNPTGPLTPVPVLPRRPKPPIPKSGDTFVVAQLPGGTGAFHDGSEFALLSDYGCLRGQNGYVVAGGGVDGDAPARLGAKFQ